MVGRGLALLAALAAFCLPAPVRAQLALSLPETAERTATRAEPLASYSFPVSAWVAGAAQQVRVEGQLDQTAWRLRASADSSLQILQGLRAQIIAAGYEMLFECETDDCGGFDFRFAMALLPEPEMHVDLGDFRYLAAQRGQGAAVEHVALVVSRSAESAFVHLTDVYPARSDGTAAAPAMLPSAASGDTPAAIAEPRDSTPVFAAAGADVGAFAAEIEKAGSVALDDLAFETGSATLSPGAYPSLAALAAYLAANPARRVALVGHTDAVGGLDANIALSRKRADAVRARLIEAYGVNAAQVSAAGAGWLSPRASNLTPEGRARNRRVEVVLTST